MDQDSTGTAPPADWHIPQVSEESLIVPCRAELSLSFDGKEGEQSYLLLIEAPTLQAVRGIFPEVSARFLNIVSRDQSNGDS